jgi:hypothetical protein
MKDFITKREMDIAEQLNFSSYLYPCTSCHGGRCIPLQGIRDHIRIHGRDPFQDKYVLGGDPPGGYSMIRFCTNSLM